MTWTTLFFCNCHLLSETFGKGETIVPLNNEVTSDDKLGIKDEVLARGSGLLIFVPNIEMLVNHICIRWCIQTF